MTVTHYRVTDGKLWRTLAISADAASILIDGDIVWYPVALDAAQSWLRVTESVTGKNAEIVNQSEGVTMPEPSIVGYYSGISGINWCVDCVIQDGSDYTYTIWSTDSFHCPIVCDECFVELPTIVTCNGQCVHSDDSTEGVRDSMGDAQLTITGAFVYPDGTVTVPDSNETLDTVRATVSNEQVTIPRAFIDNIFDTLGTTLVGLRVDNADSQDITALSDLLESIRPFTTYLDARYLDVFKRTYCLTQEEMDRITA